ncbi:sacsin N-terminal ATP-binding-like domain-containing protein [Mangrovicoccus algicola]|uniref:DUF3883 domain-containing protein n=1 Tax=Mangrovicoccus algicola TaxID=2771008 RepID=A0A8J6ZFY4_9RHOB|nr:DUF3883 domain-containing protein [Mangrovicoccus algicola]MBE3640520.1 DUF3883 domain-containing protein [Mangrovicoccus algicola]
MSQADLQQAPAIASEIEVEETPEQAIEALASGKLTSFRGTVDPNTGDYFDDVYAQNRSLTQHVAADYHGRFLIELIQNGSDAHARDQRDGEVEIILDQREGQFGTLYVANRGRPFSHENLKALTRIAMSNKPPGEAIGNKGLGFRSVSHVCDAPEVYSRRELDGSLTRFDGFCFTFARPDEFEKLLADPHLAELARTSLPVFFLPQVLKDQNDTVREFARKGFASVIRLPLRDKAAHDDAFAEIQQLNDDSAPLLLFLAHLCQLTVRIIDLDGGDTYGRSLSRTEKELPGAPAAATIVTLENSRWLVLREAVAEGKMLEAISHGIETTQLHGSWESWSGMGEVALALRLDADINAPRLYTYLPMGEGAAAPLPAHFHGSFFPTSNRKALDASVALNRLLLDEGAKLAARCLFWLTTIPLDETYAQNPMLPTEERARVAVDLLTWTDPDSLRVSRSASHLGLSLLVAQHVAELSEVEFIHSSVIPCVAPTSTDPERLEWHHPNAARARFPESDTFSLGVVPRHASAAGVALIWPGLHTARISRLIEFLKVCTQGTFREAMSNGEKARIAASIAGRLKARPRPGVGKWTAFYRDLLSFVDQPAALTGLPIILCDDGTVRADGKVSDTYDDVVETRRRRRRRRGEPIAPSLFFPPARRPAGEGGEPTELLRVPVQLGRYFAFASNALPWHGELRKTREYLETGLVSAYDGDAVLTRIAQVVQANPTIEQAIAGLRWAFSIWRRTEELGRPIAIDKRYRLLVPTVDNDLIVATDAVFSETWPEETLGRRLGEFLATAPNDVPDLITFKGKRLAPTAHRAFKGTRIDQWTRFLSALGVRCGLQAFEPEGLDTATASQFKTFEFARKIGLSDAAIDEWRRDLEVHQPHALTFSYTTLYRFSTKIWCLPGQNDHQRFSPECRELYAALVIEWAATVPTSQLVTNVQHTHYTSDSREWSTPAGAFLRSAEWMPAEEPSADGGRRGHYRLSEIWVSNGIDRYPYYLRQLTARTARALDRAPPNAARRLKEFSLLRTLNQPGTQFAQLGFLAQQYEAGSVSQHYEPFLANLYNLTWKTAADRHAVEPQFPGTPDPEMPLLVRKAGDLMVVVPGAKGAPPVYVRDIDDEIAASLIGPLGGAMLDVKGADRSRIGNLLSAIYGHNVSRLSALQYDVRVDGAGMETLEADRTAIDLCPWLRPMLAIALEGVRGTAASQLPADRSPLLAALANVRVQQAERIEFEINGTSFPYAVDKPAVNFRRADGVPIVVILNQAVMTWGALDRCIPAICEAIDLPIVAANMRLLANSLAQDGESIDRMDLDQESIDRLCRTLLLDNGAAASARNLMGERLDVRMPWIRAAFHYAGGRDALDRLHALEFVHEADMAALISELEPMGREFGLSVPNLIDNCRRTFATDQFQELMQFEFARFNFSLAETGSEPVTHPELHATLLAQFISCHEADILLSLRNSVAADLSAGKSAPRYASLRDTLRALAPDPAWLTEHVIVPEELLLSFVETWLTRSNAPSLGSNDAKLSPVFEVRAANQRAISQFSKTATPLVRAWHLVEGVALPETWHDSGSSERYLRAGLDKAGITDFRPLDSEDILKWCVDLKLWPIGMGASLDRETLGIPESEIAAAQEASRREADARAALARSVPFNGRNEDPQNCDWSAISVEIGNNLSSSVKSARLGTLANLAEVKARQSGHRNPPMVPRNSDAPSRMPQEKKDMIGRLGELVVYHWLKDRFRTQDIDKAWVSKNATLQIGAVASDSLGYDFEVEYDRKTWLIEVKASQGDSCRFEMGETEVRAAREAAKPRSKKRYVIAYVADPATPLSTRIEILPNPMSEEADGVLDLLGEGVRFGFRRR